MQTITATVATALNGATYTALPSGTSVSISKNHRRGRDPFQHQHRSRDGCGQDPPEQRPARGQEELQERGNDDKSFEQSRAASLDHFDAEPDEGGGAAHHDYMAGCDPMRP